jgi:hypothetical protein
MNLFDSDNYPTSEPLELVVGDRWTWKRNEPDYGSGYTLKYSFRRESDGIGEIEITATHDGTDYVVEVAQATTTAFISGKWHWQAYITRDSDSERVTIDSGRVTVKANRDISTDDPREHAEKMLAAIEATLESKATKDQLSYSISTGDGGSRSISRMSFEELMDARSRYKAELDSIIAAERIEKGLGTGRKVLARFA